MTSFTIQAGLFAALLFLFSLPVQLVLAADIDARDNPVPVQLPVVEQEQPVQDSESQSRIPSLLKEILADEPTVTLGYTTIRTEPAAVDKILRSLYGSEPAPYWVTEQGPGAKAESLLSVLAAASEEGLDPSLYQLTEIQKLWLERNPASLARLDVMLTLAMAAYVNDMREGRAISCLLDPKLFAAARDKEVDIPEVIRQGLTTPDLAAFLQMQAPLHFAYQSLKKTLANYKKLAAAGGWPEIPAGKTLKPGMGDDRLALLIKRLSITGDLNNPPETTPLTYTDQLVEAIKHFQYRYNLEQDGVIGKNTLSALNIPVQDHINKIILNLERWRWLPHTLEGKRILVNIAGFQLAALEDEKIEMEMPVIVGKILHETPVFSHAMTYIVVNPYWNIPTSIAVKEMVPKMIKDPGYLQSQRIKIFQGWQENSPEVDPASIDWHTIGSGIKRYRLRQEPGPGNALGTIKFMFPNNNNIYMHDTPTHSLFRRSKRSFSHGCIRLSQPIDLAVHILGQEDKNWTKKRIQEMIASKKRSVIRLQNPWPVHILYRTVQVDPDDGTVFFYDDVYGRDALLAKALLTSGQPVQCRYSYQ
jgi:murein L,D-transpeptidase YcbB/YkuD